MKKKQFTLSIIIVLITAAAFKTADDIIARLGMQQQNAQWHIMRNFIGRFDNGTMDAGIEDGPANSVYKQLQGFQIPRATMLSSVISGDKAGTAKELCEYVKKYVNSIEFSGEYAKLREDAMPLQDMGMSLGQLKEKVRIHQININNYKTDTKYVAEQQGQIDMTQKRIDAMMEAAKKPFEGKAAWEKLYPADPALMIKARLQEYLQTAATVDFTAKLTGTGKKQLFVNPAYEKKSLKWKAIYRAGKEVNDVVTAFVKEWLKGEIISKEKTSMTAAAAIPTTTPQAAPAENKTTAQVQTPAKENTQTEAVPAATPDKKKINTGKLKDKLKSIIKN